ncbi:MAG: hypothetical protein FWE03_02665 [Firmicutes bacterium]|nr:hypothetical protein [Bacillota bacterium]
MEITMKELRDTIVDFLKTQYHTNLVSASINGFNVTATDIAVPKGNEIQVFRIAVVKHKTKKIS